MSTDWIRHSAAAGVAAVAVLAGASACDGLDGVWPERSDPRLLAEGPAGDARWAVVLIHERGRGDCLEFRHRGVVVDSRCAATTFLDRYTLGISVLRGTSTPMIFGVLPEGAARAEVPLDGTPFLRRRDPEGPVTPVEVRTFGESGRYVVGPAPTGRQASGDAWRDGTTVSVEVYDDQDRHMAPE